MKALILSLAAASVMLVSSTASAGIAVRVGPVRVAAGRRVAPPVRRAYVAPSPARAVVRARHYNYRNAVEERRDTIQDVREERLDTILDIREERRQAAWSLFQSLQP